jgi:ATP-dependent DNA helicase recG
MEKPIMRYTLEELCTKKENQVFDRKSARKDAKGLSNHIVAFANADGGTLVIGVEDNGEITGIDAYTNNINDILRVPFDYCNPSVRVTTETVECKDKDGNLNHLLIMTIPQSSELHANQQDEVYYRMGDKSKKLNFDERLQLMYAKGSRYYEDEPVFRSTLDDIDMDFVAEYCKKIGYTKSPEEYIRQNKDYIVKHDGREEMSGAALLLFGADPQRFFPRARVRFIRYDGTEAKVGTQMNVIKDEVFSGRILDMVQQALDFVRSQIKERTRLGGDGRFVTTPEYPEFAWKESIVNAVAHRDYSIKGTDIQIKMFDDRITVESPGILPGIVRLSNLRTVHFSRNPKIAEFLHQYDYVKEFGEGVDRMFKEMENAGLPAPEYSDNVFMLNVTIRNGAINEKSGVINGAINGAINLSSTERAVLEAIIDTPNITKEKLQIVTSLGKGTIDRAIKTLKEKEIIKRVGSNKNGYWEMLK